MKTVDELVASLPSGQFIGGVWTDDQPTIDVVNPATGKVLTTIADASVEQGLAALDAAVAAQESWGRTEPRHRAEILRRAFELLQERADDFALCMTLEMGKTLAEARGELNYGAEFFRWFSEEACRIEGRFSIAPSGNTRLLTMKQPVGPSFAITPWNFPLAMGTRKIGPALAAGCTIVVNPAHETPLTTLLLMRVLEDAGVPAGVVNCITTANSREVSAAIIADPRLRKLSFTGSTQVGQKLIAQSAQNVLRISMELGGNAPFLVLKSANVDAAVAGAMQAKMRNIGEACTAANRFIVHEHLAVEFSTKFAAKMAALRVGDGTVEGVDVGPLVTQVALDNVISLVAEAVAGGARVLAGGERLDGDGFFMSPTVLTDVPANARVLTEEIFGPVAPIVTFSTNDEALALANGTEYGLVGYLFAEDLREAFYVTERLETGMVGLNTGIVSNPAAPFGGVKASGLGREGSHEGIDEYLETKYVGMAL